MVEVLKNELKLQGDHFEKTAKSQAQYYSQLAEKSVSNERQIQELITRLSSEQSEKYKREQAQEVQLRTTEDMALEKVKVLQVELQKQEDFFKIQERNYQEQIEMLKQEIVRVRLAQSNRDEQVNEIVELAGDYKRQNRVLKNEQVLAQHRIQDGDQRLLKL